LYNSIQKNTAPPPPYELSSSPGFTIPPPLWNEFNMPIIYTQYKRGSNYMDLLIESSSWLLTLIIKRVKLKVKKVIIRELGVGQLVKEHLHSVLAKEAERKACNNALDCIVQKFGEIKGSETQRQMIEDYREEEWVINIRKKCA